MKIAIYEHDFNSFGHSAVSVESLKNPWTSFSLLKVISKDARFYALSKYIITSIITFVPSLDNLKKLKKRTKSAGAMNLRAVVILLSSIFILLNKCSSKCTWLSL